MSRTILPSPADRAQSVRDWAQDAVDRKVGIRRVAEALGVSKGAVESLLRGGMPQDDTLRRMEEALAAMAPTPTPEANADKPPPYDGERLGIRERLEQLQREAAGDLVKLMHAADAMAALLRAEQGVIDARAAETRTAASRDAENVARLRMLATTIPTPAPAEELSDDELLRLAARGTSLMRRLRAQVEAELLDQAANPQRAAGGS